MRQWATWTSEPKYKVPSMQAMPADIGLARGQAFSAATVLILGCGLALYQMTSLMLGTAGSRQLDLSLSIPTVESRDFAEPLATKAGVIGSLVTPLSATSGSMAGRRIPPPSLVHPTTTITPVPVVTPPSAVTVPPAALPTAQPAGRPLPVPTVPQPERADLPGDETD